MRRQLKKVDSHINVHLFLGIDAQIFIWINWHQEGPNVGLIEITKISEKDQIQYFASTEYYWVANISYPLLKNVQKEIWLSQQFHLGGLSL